MQLIADRFVMDDRGHSIDLATGDRVCLVWSAAGGPTEEARWAERCSWFSMVVQPSIAPLLDYGTCGDTRRFEAWGAQVGWLGAAGASDAALGRAARFLGASGRAPVSRADASLGCRGGRPVIVPDAGAGIRLEPGAPAAPDDGPDLLGVMRRPDRRLAQVADIFSGQTPSRVVAVAVWAPDEGGAGEAVRALARAARLAGCIPVSSALFSAPVRTLVRGRTVVLFARDDVDIGWRTVVEASLDSTRPHIVVFAGTRAVRRVHTVSLERWSVEQLIASVCPPGPAARHVRRIGTAARRSQGLRGRFEQLLLGGLATVSEFPRGGPAVMRAAETATTDLAEAGARVLNTETRPSQGWPAPGELARLGRQMESARASVASGRYRPGERLARQAMHAFGRRGEWAAAAEGSLILAQSLVSRGRLTDASSVLDGSRAWATKARDLRLLQALALLTARVQTESGRLSEAEALVETALASVTSVGSGGVVHATLALVRCLYWQGRFADAWQRLMLVQPDAEEDPRDSVRLWVARSRVAIGRGRVAEAVGDAARARDAAVAIDDPALCGAAFYACALAQLAAGDATQAAAAAAAALQAARRAHDPMLALSVRVLRAEVARRQGQRGPALLLVSRMARIPAQALPATIRARIDLLRDVLRDSDEADAAERRAELTGLPAVRLFAPSRPPAPVATGAATEDIVELLRCCQVADDDREVLTAVCARLRERLRAAGVSFFAVERNEVVVVAGDGTRVDPLSARRVQVANQLVLPHHGGEQVEAGVPVRYAGNVTGMLVATWTAAAVWDPADVSVLLATGATAAGPALSSLCARRAGDRVSRTSELLGVSAAVADVRMAIEKAASAPFSVLIEGESGSGKELVAQLLHKLGARRDRPLCSLSCAALPDDLVESELFGHARGAFTGAVAERRGVFEEAHTGTLFLDEIGELSARAQAKMLRAIQEGEIRRVGENTSRRVDVRLVTATNRDLRVEAAAGRFRHDLLYRLDVVRIVLPPLRDRRDDVAVLAEHFWRDATGRIGSRAALSAATFAALARYDWPGNIRELQNVLASLAVRAPRRGVVPPTALPPQFGERGAAASFKLETARRTFDRSFIRAALVRAGGQRTQAAEELGVSRQGLAKLLARLEIEPVATA